jgi:hypothetical protein
MGDTLKERIAQAGPGGLFHLKPGETFADVDAAMPNPPAALDQHNRPGRVARRPNRERTMTPEEAKEWASMSQTAMDNLLRMAAERLALQLEARAAAIRANPKRVVMELGLEQWLAATATKPTPVDQPTNP